ncbi:MAG: transposase [Nitrospirae bacterium]|nr:transposase [Magnetococcales bacterium]
MQKFDNRFPNKDACQEYVLRLRWPDGFVCPKHANANYSWRGHQNRNTLGCGNKTLQFWCISLAPMA